MKLQITCLLVLSTAALHAQTNTNAVLSAAVYPGYVFNTTELLNASKLNRLGRPTVFITGTLSGSSAIGAGVIIGTHLSTNIVGLGATNGLKFDTDHNLAVDAADLAGLGLFSPTADKLAVNIDSNHIIWDSAGTNLTVNWTNYDQVTVPTNNDVFTFYSVATNNYNAYGTNPAMRTISWGDILSQINTKFESGESNIVVSPTNMINMAHRLGVVPARVRAVLVCRTNGTAAQGFDVGDEVDFASAVWSPNWFPGTVSVNLTNVYVTAPSTTFRFYNRATGDLPSSMSAGWKVKVYCRQ